MKNWTIYDSQSNPLEGFDVATLPRQASDFLTAYVRKSENGIEQTWLEAGPYVGAVPLLDGSTLYLAPRIGYPSLARMLSVTERLDNAVAKEFQQFAELGFDEKDYSTEWVNLLSRSFAAQLKLVEKNSLRSEREWQKENNSTVKGRINLVATALRLDQNKEHPVISLRKVKVYNTVENRFLAAAAQTILNFNMVESVEKEIFSRWARILEKTPLTEIELEKINRNISAGRYAGSRSYYIPSLVMAKLILLQGSLSIEGLNKVRSEALLTNVYLLFETYLRVLLRKHLTDEGFLIEKLDAGTPSLFIDGTAELHPDIIISRGVEVKLLIDAKYKLDEKISNADYFQMKAYMEAFDVEHGVITRPARADQDNSLVSRKLYSGHTIHEIRLNLQDWGSAEHFFADAVRNILI